MTEVQLRALVRSSLLTLSREALEEELARATEAGNRLREEVIRELLSAHWGLAS